MLKFKRVFICCLCIISMLFTNISVYAADTIQNKENASEKLEFITIEEMVKIQANSPTASSDTYVNIAGAHSFPPYVQSTFSKVNSCGPIAMANILSYYKNYKGINLYSSDEITPELFDQICTDCKWTTGGTSLHNVGNALETFCSRVGKTCVIDTYLLNMWSDVTRDINANKPILMSTDEHIYVILGYQIINSEKYLYVLSGLDGDTMTYGNVKWKSIGIGMKSVVIY